MNNLRDNDVLCGRGGATYNHSGNKRFRELVKNRKDAYLSSNKTGKKIIAKFIVDAVRDSGGRFVKYKENGTELTEIGEVAAIEKTCQALREGLEVRAKRSRTQANNSNTASRAHSYYQHPTYQPHPPPPPHPYAYHHHHHHHHNVMNPERSVQIPPYMHSHPSSMPAAVPGPYYDPYRHHHHQYQSTPPYNPPIQHVPYTHSRVYSDMSVISHEQRSFPNAPRSESIHIAGKCTCKKSKCLKLYCQCFAASKYCDPNVCQCVDCSNNESNLDEINEARKKIELKNPLAFR